MLLRLQRQPQVQRQHANIVARGKAAAGYTRGGMLPRRKRRRQRIRSVPADKPQVRELQAQFQRILHQRRALHINQQVAIRCRFRKRRRRRQ